MQVMLLGDAVSLDNLVSVDGLRPVLKALVDAVNNQQAALSDLQNQLNKVQDESLGKLAEAMVMVDSKIDALNLQAHNPAPQPTHVAHPIAYSVPAQQPLTANPVQQPQNANPQQQPAHVANPIAHSTHRPDQQPPTVSPVQQTQNADPQRCPNANPTLRPQNAPHLVQQPLTANPVQQPQNANPQQQPAHVANPIAHSTHRPDQQPPTVSPVQQTQNANPQPQPKANPTGQPKNVPNLENQPTPLYPEDPAAHHILDEAKKENWESLLSQLGGGGASMDINYIPYPRKWALIHHAVQQDNVDIVRRLMQMRAAIDLKAKLTGDTPLDVAIEHNSPNCLNVIRNVR